MKKIILASIISILIAGCSSSENKSLVNNLTFSSSIDKEITLVKGRTKIKEVEDELGSPENKVRQGNDVRYDYTSSHLFRDLSTGLLIGWQFLDNHVLTLCESNMKDCKVFKASDDEEAKSLRIYFHNGVVADAQLIETEEALKKTLGF